MPSEDLPGSRGVFDPFSSVGVLEARKPNQIVPKPRESAILVNTVNPKVREGQFKNGDGEKGGIGSRWDKKPQLQGPKGMSGKG